VTTAETDRLLIRLPLETDRARFVELFNDPAFTVFADSVNDISSANARFDRMLMVTDVLPYGKQPIVEKSTGTIVGYTGVDSITYGGSERLEWGWRLAPSARGKGYATEAAVALLSVADTHDNGELLCVIATENIPSRRVADKVGFRFWQHVIWPDGVPTDLLVRDVGTGGAPLRFPPATYLS